MVLACLIIVFDGFLPAKITWKSMPLRASIKNNAALMFSGTDKSAWYKMCFPNPVGQLTSLLGWNGCIRNVLPNLLLKYCVSDGDIANIISAKAKLSS